MSVTRLVDGLTTAEAAGRLGVNQSRVRQLLSQGALYGEQLSSGDWIVNSASVAERARSTPSAGRVWKTETAWTVLWSLIDSQHKSMWVSGVDGHSKRARNYLVHCDAPELAAKLSAAIPLKRYEAEDPQSVAKELALSGRSRASVLEMGLRDRADVVEGYTTSDCIALIVKTHALVESVEGNVAIGILPAGMETTSQVWKSLIAVDMTRSSSTRERSAGLRALSMERERWLLNCN